MRHRFNPIQPGLAVASTGLVLLVLANTTPLLVFDVLGNRQENLIITGVTGLFAQGYGPIGALVFFCAIAAPAGYFVALWISLLGCARGRRSPGLLRAVGLAERLQPWCLAPIFAIACFVAAVKLETLGEVSWKQGTLWTVALGACSMFLGFLIHPHDLRRRVEPRA